MSTPISYHICPGAMKIVSVLLFCLFLSFRLQATEGTDKAIRPDQLPQKAKQFIADHFPNLKISLAKVDREVFDTEYGVIFTNGSKIQFDARGNWMEVNCQYSQLPASVVPVTILKYVRQNFPDQAVVKIKYERKIYAVYLTNDRKLYFDHLFNIIEATNLVID